MKKAPILVIFILVLLYAAAPYLVGMKVKSDIEHLVSNLNNTRSYSVNIEQYDRHWFSSSGVFSIGVDMTDLVPSLESNGLFSDQSFSFNIDHGPFINGFEPGLLKWKFKLQDTEALRAYAKFEEGIPFYTSSGKVHLNGSVNFQDTIPILESSEQIEEVLSYTIGGYAGFGEFIDGEMFYESSTGSIEINTADDQVQIRPIDLVVKMDMDLEKILDGGLYNSYATLIIEEIDIDGLNRANISSLEVESEMSLTEGADLANIELHYFLGALNTTEFSLEDFFLDLSIENYSEEFHSAYVQFSKTVDLNNPDQSAYNDFLVDSFPLLLKASPKLHLDDLSFNLPNKGEFRASTLADFDAIDELPEDPTDWLFWKDKLFAQASLSADLGVIEYLAYLQLSEDIAARQAGQEMTAEEIQAAVNSQVQFGISMLSGMGIISPTEKGYEVKAEYDHGAIQVNGEDFSLPFGGF